MHHYTQDVLAYASRGPDWPNQHHGLLRCRAWLGKAKTGAGSEPGGLIDVGKLRVIVDKEFHLKLWPGMKLSEAGHVRGKIILNIAS